MNILDMRTVFICYSISNAICAVVMVFLWRQNRKRFPELDFWLGTFILQFLAILLITLRGMIPDFLSIIVANTLGVGGMILLYMGMERFVHKISSQRHNYGLLAIFFAIHVYYTYLRPSLMARNFNFSFALTLICVQGAWLTLHKIEDKFQPDATRVGFIFVAIGLVNIIRIFVDSNLLTSNDFFNAGPFETIVILSYQMLYLSLTFALFLAVNHRLFTELEGDIITREQMELSAQQRLLELETVNTLSIAMRAGENLEELLRILLRETVKVVTATDGCILLLDPADNNTLRSAESRGWFRSMPELSFKIDEGVVGNVFTSSEPYISLDLQNDLLVPNQTHTFTPIRASGAILPIRGEQDSIGILIVSFELSHAVSENEIRLLAIISQLAANAISRCSLHDQVRCFNTNLQKEIQQKTAIQELLATEKELLSTTLMSIADGVIVTDKDGLVFLFNRAAEKITGFTSSEAIEKPVNHVFKLHTSNTLEPVPDVIHYLFEQENASKNADYRSPLIITKTGEKILLSGSITSLKSTEDHNAGFVIAFQNINEKQKAEAQNMLSQKMEAIGQLAAGIAHEINTPIQYVGDNIKFLEKAFSKYLETLAAYQQVFQEHREKNITQDDLDRLEELAREKKVAYYANEIPKAIEESLDGTERVRKIVLAMREFSHPSEKEKKFSDINHGIETTIAISRNEWKYFAELETDLDPELPLVYCQIDEINQVILNMIVNASQAIQDKNPQGSGQKGKISIGTRKLENKVLITVQDTGSGIPSEIQARVFDPFFTTKGVGKGTGQGLSMAHNIIVTKHHGLISIESDHGDGTTFTIELPIDASELEQK